MQRRQRCQSFFGRGLVYDLTLRNLVPFRIDIRVMTNEFYRRSDMAGEVAFRRKRSVRIIPRSDFASAGVIMKIQAVDRRPLDIVMLPLGTGTARNRHELVKL